MNNLPKILILSAVADRTERCLFEGLAKVSGFHVDMIVDPKEPYKEELASNGINVIEIHIKHRFDLANAWGIRQLIKKNHYDIIYSTFNKGLSVSLFAACGIKTQVVTYRGTLGNVSHWDPSCWFAHLHPHLRMIVCNCHAVQNFLHDFGIPERKLYTIYKGHRLGWYQGENKPDLSEFGVPSDSFVVGCIANVRALKGIDFIIKAIHQLKEFPIHLVVVGENSDPSYQQLADSLGISDKVHLLGFKKNSVEFIRSFDVSVMASTRREGLPRSIVESMAQGVPAIVTNIGGMPELVQNEKTGLVVPPKDADALAKAIKRLYSDRELLEQFGVKSIEWIIENFNADKALVAFSELFKSLKEENDGNK